MARRLRYRKVRLKTLVLFLPLPVLVSIATLFNLARMSEEDHVTQPRVLPPRQPIKVKDGLKGLDMFLPSGGELEKKLIANKGNHVTSDVKTLPIFGGHYSPRLVAPRHKIAVIVPYRDRAINLKRFLQHIHPFLQRQDIEYTVYVVEMEADGLFRKTVIMNAGFLEVMKREAVTCVIFHDVDMIPVHDENIYYCDHTVRHLAISITQFEYKKPYDWYIGGVVAFPKDHFIRVNGYSNLYIGWGGEDDDMYYRIQACDIEISEPSPEVGRYESWPHDRQDLLMNMKDYSNNAAKRIKDDGLSNVKYKLVGIEEKQLYTWIRIETDPTDIFNDKYLELQPVFIKW